MADENNLNYLEHSEFIDWREPAVYEQAMGLAKECANKVEIAQACFYFVRDEIQHSWDFQRNPITCRASEVLMQGTGYCYAKSHLLAALLRANKIPAALCYQRLTTEGNQPPYSLHGLNSIYLDQCGWYRIDARGNKEGVNAEFMPPKECLAFPLLVDGEMDIEERYSKPLLSVVEVLSRYHDYQQVSDNLPDMDIT